MPEGHITVVHRGFVLLLDQQQSETERRPSGSCSGALFMDKVEIFVWMASSECYTLPVGEMIPLKTCVAACKK